MLILLIDYETEMIFIWFYKDEYGSGRVYRMRYILYVKIKLICKHSI